MNSDYRDQRSSKREQWTLKEIISASTVYLESKQIASARLEVELLLGHVLSMKRIELYTNFDRPISEDEKSKFRQLLSRCGSGEPSSYIIGEKNFFGYSITVDPCVLIPRGDTEVLVEAVIRIVEASEAADPKILDVGTGSGCIAIALGGELPGASVNAIDISSKAVSLARQNAESNGIKNIELSVQDMADDAWWQDVCTFDVIVSNPPYIADDEKPDMNSGVLDYEPHLALFADDSGLFFYNHIAAGALKSLSVCGHLFLEIGYKQASAVEKILSNHGWADIRVIKDYSGHDRVVHARPPTFNSAL